jgi:hypothetical protein
MTLGLVGSGLSHSLGLLRPCAHTIEPGRLHEHIGVPLFAAYVVVSVLAALALTFSATADLVRYEKVLIAMEKAGVPQSWLTTLGLLKAAGALGILVGIGVPLIGTVAAVGVILFFLGAIITHLRARWYSFGLPAVYLLLAVGSLMLRLAQPSDP